MTIRDLQYKTQDVIDDGIMKDSAQVKIEGGTLFAEEGGTRFVLCRDGDERGYLQKVLKALHSEMYTAIAQGDMKTAQTLNWACGEMIRLAP